MQSSPGFPFFFQHSNNAQVLKNVPMRNLINIVQTRLQLLADANVEGMDAITAVGKGLVDPVRLFVKQEPHSDKKRKAKRWRLIHSVSLIDQIVERIMFSDWQNFCIRNHHDLPMQSGIGDTDYEWEVLTRFIMRMENPVDSDAKGWDFSVDGEDYEWLLAFRDFAIHFVDPRMRLAMINYIRLRKKAIFVLSNGVMLEQEFDGIFNSGCYMTSSGNSEMRAGMAYQLSGRPPRTMGDDCVEDSPKSVEEMTRWYLERGKVMEMHEVQDTYEFCSHRVEFSSGEVEYLNLGKTLFRFVNNPSAENYCQLRMLVRTPKNIQTVEVLRKYVTDIERLK